MKLTMYQVDAFSRTVFGGNPAAVCPLKEWLPDATMQAIAAENALSETAFFVPRGDQFHVRWFTPLVEVELCGHATLASGYIVLTELEPSRSSVRFHSRSGELGVARDGDRFAMALPRHAPEPCDPPPALLRGLGRAPSTVLAGGSKLLCVYESADEVAALVPEMAVLATLSRYGVIVTAPGRDCDFVSRFFAPAAGVPEDPVTGSAHCLSVPYWAERLKKPSLFARQISRRGGELWCTDGAREVTLAGYVAPYLVGTIDV